MPLYVCVHVCMCGHQVVCASMNVWVCVGCFLFIAGVVHVKAHTVEESRCKYVYMYIYTYVCMCLCTLKATELLSIIKLNKTKKKKNKKKHERKKLKAKSTLAIQVDQNVTRGWRVLAPTAPIKLRQQTHIQTYIHYLWDPTLSPPIDWSINRLIGQWTHKRTKHAN